MKEREAKYLLDNELLCTTANVEHSFNKQIVVYSTEEPLPAGSPQWLIQI
jgi:hypothetical protein